MSTDATTAAPLLLSVEQCAGRLGVGQDLVRRWAAEGMPCLWSGGAPGTGKLLFHPDLVERWLMARMLGSPDPDRGPEPGPARPRGGRRGARAAGKSGGKYTL